MERIGLLLRTLLTEHNVLAWENLVYQCRCDSYQQFIYSRHFFFFFEHCMSQALCGMLGVREGHTSEQKPSFYLLSWSWQSSIVVTSASYGVMELGSKQW